MEYLLLVFHIFLIHNLNQHNLFLRLKIVNNKFKFLSSCPMANTFNISVKPEIAALETKVDTIDTVVDAIRGTDVVNLASLIANNATDIGLIRTEDVVGLDALLDINTAHLVTIDSLADAIKLKTDLIPQNVRGQFLTTGLGTANAEFQTVLDVTGKGILLSVTVGCISASDTLEVRITIDGRVQAAVTHTGDTIGQLLIPNLQVFGLPNPMLQMNKIAVPP
ncbi:MAG: hypothetical protein GH151_01925, partial [Bacteroidetes bacterium]|nr:hypothetical protein [Bacteroidota bacterium]